MYKKGLQKFMFYKMRSKDDYFEHTNTWLRVDKKG